MDVAGCIRLTLHEPARLGKEFWSCVLNMYGWIYVNSKLISLKLKLVLSQGTTTAYVPTDLELPVGYRGGLSNGITLEHPFGDGFVGQGWRIFSRYFKYHFKLHYCKYKNLAVPQ